MGKRGVTSIVQAIKAEVRYGGDGRFYYQSMDARYKQRKAAWNTLQAERTFDDREACALRCRASVAKSLNRPIRSV